MTQRDHSIAAARLAVKEGRATKEERELAAWEDALDRAAGKSRHDSKGKP